MSSTKRAFEKIRIDGKNFAIICQVKPKGDPKKEKYSVISFQLYLFVCSRLRISFSLFLLPTVYRFVNTQQLENY